MVPSAGITFRDAHLKQGEREAARSANKTTRNKLMKFKTRVNHHLNSSIEMVKP